MLRNRLALSLSLTTLVAGGLAGCGHAPPPVAPTPSPQIEASIKSQASAAAPDTEMVGQLFRGVAYDKGELTDWHVELTQGNCYWFIGAGDGGVEKLSVYVWDQSNSRVAQERSKTNTAVVQACPKSTGTFKVEAKVMGGAGHYALGVFAKAAPEPPPEPVKEEKKGPDLEAIINKDAAAQAPGATLVGDFYSAANGKMDWYTTLSRGKCYWFIGAGGDDIDDFYIYLWDPSNKRVGEQKSSGRKATFGHCPKEDGMFHIQVKTDSKSEKFKLGVFQKAK